MTEMPSGEMGTNNNSSSSETTAKEVFEALKTQNSKETELLQKIVSASPKEGFSELAKKESVKEAIESLKRLNSQEIELLQKIVAEVSDGKSSGGMSAVETGGFAAGDPGAKTAIERGMDAAGRVKDLGFVEFTAGLINGTFDAIVSSTIKQMEAYAKLVADLSKSIQQFQSENVSDAQISAHLAQRYPDGKGGTVVVPDVEFTETPADTQNGVAAKSASAKFQEVVNALIAETKKLKEDQRLNASDISSNNATKFTQAQVQKIRTAIGYSLATNMIDQLRQMARDGMARIVITEGELLTKLTFNITVTEGQQKQKSNLNQNENKVNISGGAGMAWWRVNASVSNSNLNVNTMNESSFDNSTMNAQMIGEVRIKFKTESFPPYEAPPAVDEKPAVKPAPEPG